MKCAILLIRLIFNVLLQAQQLQRAAQQNTDEGGISSD
jgi:hypothetical protein